MLWSKSTIYRSKCYLMIALVVWSTLSTSVLGGGVIQAKASELDEPGTSQVSTSAALQMAPVADAGPDQTVLEGSAVQLDGSASEGHSSSFEQSYTEGALPGGTTLSLALTALGGPDDSGSQLLSGNFSLGGGVPTPSTALAYVVDLSGSTLLSGGCGGDQDGDGAANTIVDCEIAATKAVNDQAAANGIIAEVSVVPFASSSVAADVGPASGFQIITGPGTDAGGLAGHDVDEVLESMRASYFSPYVRKFTLRSMSAGTNYSAGINATCNALANATVPNRIAVFLSDGENLLGSPVGTVLPCAQPVKFHTFAVGSLASCSGNPSRLGSLQDIANLTGGTCTEVPDVSSLPDILPKVVASELIRLELSIDGGSPIDISDTIDPPLPLAGPVAMDISAAIPELAPGSHEICLTATGVDAGGEGSVTTCAQNIEGSGALTFDWQLISASGPPVQLSSTTSPQPSFLATDDGSYTFRLTVTDSFGYTASDQVTVQVDNVAPQVSAISVTTADSRQAFSGGVTLVTASLTDEGWLDTHLASFDWGDGSPVEAVPVNAQGAGWGSFFGSHIYSSGGSFVITVTVEDDNGGISTGTISLEVAYSAAVWANSRYAPKTLNWGGGSGLIEGRVQSNNAIVLYGGVKVINGLTEYVNSIEGLEKHTFNPAPIQTSASDYPLYFDLSDYRPDGAVQLQVGDDYHDRSADCDPSSGKWHLVNEVLPSGVYYAACDVEMNGSNIGGRITLAAEGSIKVSGSLPAFEPFYDGLLFLSGDTGDKAIDISASDSKFLGFLFSELGQIDVSGADNHFFCGLFADRISLTGSRLLVRGGDCGRPSSTVATPLIVPSLQLSLEVGSETTLPGEALNYDLEVENTGSLLVVPGVIGLENVDSTAATVKSYAYILEYFSIASQAWLPLASAAAAADGYTPIAPLPTIGGATLSIRPNPFTGVTYPADGDPVLNTILGPDGFATWGYQALVNLAPDQVQMLLDPAQVGGFRNRVDFELEPASTQVRRLYRFGSDFIGELRALSGDIADVEITFTPPAGDPRLITSVESVDLDLMAPGDSVVLSQAYQVPVIEARRAIETEDGYRARLLAFDGASLFGSAYARARGGVGLLVAPQVIRATTETAPVLTLAKTGPAGADAGALIGWNIRLGNLGLAEARSMEVTDTLDGAPLAVVGAPVTLAPTQVIYATASYSIPEDHPGGTLENEAEVSWSDAAGNSYGPIYSTAATAVMTAPALSASLVDSLYLDQDNNGFISPGDAVNYEARVRNSGDNALTGVAFSVPVDPLTTLIPGSVVTTQGTVTSGNTMGDTTVLIAAGALVGHSEFTVSWRVTIANPLPEGVNTLSVQGEAASNELPPVLSDDPAISGAADPTVTLVVVPAPVIGFSLTGALASDLNGDGYIGSGDTVRYTAKILNTGGIAATGVQAMFPPDENSTLIPGSVVTSQGSVASGNQPGDAFVEVDIGEIAISSEILITFDITVNDPVPPGITTISVQGWLSSNELDPVLSDDPTTAAETDATTLPVFSTSGGGGGGGPAPTIGAIAPEDGLVVTEPVTISAQLTPPEGESVVAWRVTYRPADSDVAIEFSSGTGESVSATLDPTLLANGAYIITIETEASGGGVSTSETSVIVDGEFKPGRFMITYLDLNVNMGGLPLQVLRTYDSYNKSSGDFGVGWTLDIANFKVGINKPLGLGGWSQSFTCGLIFCTIHYFTLTPHFVTVTWPDGAVEIFDMTPADGSTFFRPLTAAQFTARPGSTSKLEALDNSLFYTGDGNLYGGAFGTDGVYDPQRFRLTDRYGNQYILDRSEGLLSATDSSANTLTFSDDGVFSSLGPSLEFTRDAAGRISQITDPNASVHTYSYTANGDLSGHTDPEGNTTQYFYDSNHNLMEVIDPRGVQAARSEYDSNGRLVAFIDANGNRIEYTHNIGDRQEIVRDRLGRITVLEYDADGNIIMKTDPLGNTTAYTYDSQGNKLSETDPLGNTIQYTYDDQNSLLTRTDALGNVTRFTYNATGRLLTMTSPKGSVTSFTYDANGNPITATDALGHTASQAYDAQGNIISTTDSLGNTTYYEYDAAGKLITMIDALGHAKTFTYDGNGNQLTETNTRTNALGISVTLTTTSLYDQSNRLVQTIDAEGHSTYYEYDALGQLTAKIDKNGNRIEYEYDLLGNLVRAEYPDGTAETATYDAMSNRTSITDRAGRTTRFTYDALDRLVSTIHPDNSVRTIEYDAAGRVNTMIDENGNRMSLEYDPAGRLIRWINALSNAIAFTYDSHGNLVQETDPGGGQTAYEYDTLDRLVRTVFSDGASSSTLYDNLGNTIAQVDLLGNTTRFEYDRLGRLAKVIDALGNPTTYAYDEVGNLMSETDANGNTTRWDYDNLGREIKQTLPLGMSESLTYDPNGNLLTGTDFNGQTTTFGYNTNNRLVQKTYPNGTGYSFTYTATGQRETVTEARGVTSYSYDLRDRLVEVVDPDGYLIRYAYDAAGNRTSLIAPSGTQTYTYDSLNRLSSVIDPNGGATTYQYDANGNLTGAAYPNGTRSTYAYDSRNRLISLQNKKSTGETIIGLDYTLDAAGNRLSVIENAARRTDYTYDNLSRLVQETVIDPINGNWAISYAYDAVGNRLLKTAGGISTAYSYDANNRMLAEGSATYTYDNNGNLVSKAEGANTTSYSYDYENRLVAVPGQGAFISYGYTVDGARNLSALNGVETHYLVDENRALSQVLEERASDGTLVASYTYGKDLLSQERGTDTSYYHYDGLGSTRALTDLNENITAAYSYTAFGSLVDSTGGVANNYLFAGEQFDPDTGDYYLRARYYDPDTGRFLTRDAYEFPLEDPVEHNRYSYARNNPVNFTDPTGASVAVEYGLCLNKVTVRVTPQVIALGIAVACLYWKAATAVMVANGATSSQIDALPIPGPCKVKPPGDCTPEEHRRLQDLVNAACKSGSRRCDGTQDLATLSVNMAKNLACAAARDAINIKCFRGGDPGHRQAADEARRAAERCARLIAQKCAGGC